MRDESDREGMRVVVEVRRGSSPEVRWSIKLCFCCCLLPSLLHLVSSTGILVYVCSESHTLHITDITACRLSQALFIPTIAL